MRAVDDVSFGLEAGRTLGFVGESGPGRSTVGRLLIRLLDGGRILFEGCDVAKLSEAEFRPLRPMIQMIFQDPFASLNRRSTRRSRRGSWRSSTGSSARPASRWSPRSWRPP